MSSPFNFNVSFDEIAREIKDGVREFAREFKDEAKRFEESASKGRPFEPGPGFRRFEQAFGGRLAYERYEDDEGNLSFRFLLPGFEESGIKLFFRGDTMVLKASLPEGMKAAYETGSRLLRDVERWEYPVPADRYRQAEARAALKNGVLTVTVPSAWDSSSAIKVEIVKEGN